MGKQKTIMEKVAESRAKSVAKINTTLVEQSKGIGKKFVNHSIALMQGCQNRYVNIRARNQRVSSFFYWNIIKSYLYFKNSIMSGKLNYWTLGFYHVFYSYLFLFFCFL